MVKMCFRNTMYWYFYVGDDDFTETIKIWISSFITETKIIKQYLGYNKTAIGFSTGV